MLHNFNFLFVRGHLCQQMISIHVRTTNGLQTESSWEVGTENLPVSRFQSADWKKIISLDCRLLCNSLRACAEIVRWMNDIDWELTKHLPVAMEFKRPKENISNRWMVKQCLIGLWYIPGRCQAPAQHLVDCLPATCGLIRMSLVHHLWVTCNHPSSVSFCCLKMHFLYVTPG